MVDLASNGSVILTCFPFLVVLCSTYHSSSTMSTHFAYKTPNFEHHPQVPISKNQNTRGFFKSKNAKFTPPLHCKYLIQNPYLTDYRDKFFYFSFSKEQTNRNNSKSADRSCQMPRPQDWQILPANSNIKPKTPGYKNEIKGIIS